MTDTQRKLHYYLSDATILVMAALGAFGLSLAIRRGGLAVLGLLAFGWVLYLFEEHLIHRFIFHAPAPKRQYLFDILYRLHYGHHDQVWNRHLLFTPMWFAVPLAVFDTAVLSIFMSVENAVITVCGGAIPAYLIFEWLHLTSHFKTSTKGRLGRQITRRHSKHHFIDYTRWYTVSPGGELVDKALGSDPEHYSVLPRVHTCGLEADDPRLVQSRLRFKSDASLANRRTTEAAMTAEIRA
jgi:hypothetical protein